MFRIGENTIGHNFFCILDRFGVAQIFWCWFWHILYMWLGCWLFMLIFPWFFCLYFDIRFFAVGYRSNHSFTVATHKSAPHQNFQLDTVVNSRGWWVGGDGKNTQCLGCCYLCVLNDLSVLGDVDFWEEWSQSRADGFNGACQQPS